MVVKNPSGRGVMVQTNPSTKEGLNLLGQLTMGAHFASTTGQVLVTFAPAEDIGVADRFERIVASLNSRNTETAVLPLRALQRRNQDQDRDKPRNQIQGDNRRVLCIVCQSKEHPTGQCPMPSSSHHGDTAVCPLHNSTGQYPHRGHIFDCSLTRPQPTCRHVIEAQNAIERGAQEGGEQAVREAKEAYEFLIRSLVVDRQHKAPLRVEDHTLDFVEVVLDYPRAHGRR